MPAVCNSIVCVASQAEQGEMLTNIHLIHESAEETGHQTKKRQRAECSEFSPENAEYVLLREQHEELSAKFEELRRH